VGLVLGVGLLLVARAGELQLSSRSRREAALLSAERTHKVRLPARRGRLLDARGQVLAEDRLEHDVRATLELLRSPPALAEIVAALDLSTAESRRLDARIRRLSKQSGSTPIVVETGVPEATVARLRGLRRHGLFVEDTLRRHYPLGATLGHYVGHVRHGESPTGQAGAERAFDATLSGTPGARIVPATSWVRGEVVREAGPRDGEDLALTVDASLSRRVARILKTSGARRGAVVVLDPRDGAVLSSISFPGIDSNPRARGGAGSLDDAPWVDRTRQDAQAPGALVFPFEALALRERSLGAHAETCRGYVLFGERIFRCTHLHGAVTASAAMAQHCNVFFFRNAEALGLPAMGQALRSAGMVGPVGMALGEPASSFPRDDGDARMALVAAVGQGHVQTTPLGVAVAYAAIANGGRVLAPRVRATDPVVQRGVLPSAGALGEVRDALKKSAVATGGPANVAATAATGQRRDDLHDVHWFAGFAPASAPRAVVVVLREDPSTSADAADLGYRILDAALGDEEERR